MSRSSVAGCNPGLLAELMYSRADGIGAVGLANSSVWTRAEDFAHELIEKAIELFPAEPEAWRPEGPAPAEEKTPHVRGVEDELRQKLGVKVEIQVKGKDRGRIVLGFDSNDDFERVLEVLRR